MQYAFAGFVFDLAARQLTHRSHPVSVEPKVFDLLSLLIANRDRVVPKAEVLQCLWANTHVSDAALARVVKEARRVLFDSGDEQRVIHTARGHGFRFVAPLVEVAETSGTFSDLWTRVSAARRTAAAEPSRENEHEWLSWAASNADPSRHTAMRMCASEIAQSALARGDTLRVAMAALQLSHDHTAMRPPDPVASALLRRAIELTPASEPELSARLLVHLAAEHAFDPDLTVRRATRLDALQAVRARPVGAVARAALLCTRALLTDALSHEERGQWADIVSTAASNATEHFAAALVRLEARLSQGQLNALTEGRRELLALAEQSLDARLIWRLFRRCVSHAVMHGHFDHAQRLLEEAARLAPPVEGALEGLVAQRLVLAAERGMDGPTTALDEQLVQQASTTSARCLYAWYLLERGHLEAASHAASLLWTELDTLADADNAVANAAMLTVLAHAIGNRSATEPLRRVLAPRAGYFVERASNAYHGPVERYLGLLAELEGNLELAASHLSHALTMLEASGARPAQARVATELASLCLRLGDRKRGQQLCSAALADAVALGLPRLEACAQALLARM